MKVHVLLFDAGSESEGIHSLEMAGKTVVLLFENPDDAERYAGLLEAQDFPVPSVESIDRNDVELFCRDAGYEARFIESGFVPSTKEERQFIAPPESNLDVTNWRADRDETVGGGGDPGADRPSDESIESVSSPADGELDALRKRLEGLL